MSYNTENLPDSRGAKMKYPWHELKRVGDFFVWDDVSKRISLSSCAKLQGMKVSCRLVEDKLHVIRVA